MPSASLCLTHGRTSLGCCPSELLLSAGSNAANIAESRAAASGRVPAGIGRAMRRDECAQARTTANIGDQRIVERGEGLWRSAPVRGACGGERQWAEGFREGLRCRRMYDGAIPRSSAAGSLYPASRTIIRFAQKQALSESKS